ncbi:TOG array regulator of axonemal microtubules protein 1-like [Clupea harengus]|uniref:TOG array regulator of axonemal microtubules protein 1-like n=1 Tax=Clupea harengus TaxID=7950 RepID=A0A8M1KE39_CLUHA|nr:TOG array regulator of axonemal microtubules protein 1-like [Clupea harengus]
MNFQSLKKQLDELHAEKKEMRSMMQQLLTQTQTFSASAASLSILIFLPVPPPDRNSHDALQHTCAPQQALLQAFRLLSEDDWEKKIEALTSIRSLSQHHAELLLPRLHDLCLAVTQEVKNLRSMVSRTAIVTLAHLYAHLGLGMDAEAEGTTRALLQKAGEASGFIRDDVELALGYMVVNVTPSRSMNALINTGVRHRNTAARKSTALHLGRLAEVMGSSHLLSGKNKLTDRFIHSISCLAVDCALEVRTHAHNTLAFLASHPNLIKMVERFVPQRDHITIKNIINKGQCSFLYNTVKRWYAIHTAHSRLIVLDMEDDFGWKRPNWKPMDVLGLLANLDLVDYLVVLDLLVNLVVLANLDLVDYLVVLDLLAKQAQKGFPVKIVVFPVKIVVFLVKRVGFLVNRVGFLKM